MWPLNRIDALLCRQVSDQRSGILCGPCTSIPSFFRAGASKLDWAASKEDRNSLIATFAVSVKRPFKLLNHVPAQL